jgi:hypothetical protein
VIKNPPTYGYKRPTHIVIHSTSAIKRSEELQQVVNVVYFAPNIVQGWFSPVPTDESI